VALSRPSIALPERSDRPLLGLLRRVAVAIGLLLFETLVAFLMRDGYRDAAGGGVSLLDCFYYATVSITTTGYGDITPVSDSARLVTALIITPARLLFLIILVGTTVEALAARTRTALRERAWRTTLKDHTIVCGFGTKGRVAIETLLAGGTTRESIVVIDEDANAVEAATRANLAAIHGNSGRTSVLDAAGVRQATAIVVAVDRDDTAVLTTLTARELNPQAVIVASAREAENQHLLRQSGANSVILSASAAGRLLGHAIHRPRAVEVLEDLLSVGQGVDIREQHVSEEDAGRAPVDVAGGAPVVAVVRGDEVMRYDDPRAATTESGDRLVCLFTPDA